jgi:hypothetical protein
VQAYKWLRLSSLQGNPIGKKHMLDFEAGNWAITPNEVQAADSLVEEFLAHFHEDSNP